MRIAADTNVLVRLLARDNETQNRIASRVLDEAEAVILALPMLCELAWVLGRAYRLGASEVGAAIRSLTDMPNATCDRTAIEAGLAMLDAGGDFADGVIAFEGRRMGGATFATFDRKAAQVLTEQGELAQLLG